MKNSGQNKVSIIIPTYNGEKTIGKLFNALKKQKCCIPYEIIVIDSGSKDKTLNYCRKNEAKLYKIKHSDFSHSKTRNFGASKATGNILLFMVQDAIPIGVDWLSNMITPIINDKYDAVSCNERCRENSDEFYKVNSWIHSIGVGIEYNDINNNNLVGLNSDEIKYKSWLNNVSCAISKKVFIKYKFRQDICEDVDLGLRLSKDKKRILLLKNTFVEHGHNRNASYYLYRVFNDLIVMSKIENINLKTTSNISKIADSICYGYFTYKGISNDLKRLYKNKNIIDFMHDADNVFYKNSVNLTLNGKIENNEIGDIVRKFIPLCRKKYNNQVPSELGTALSTYFHSCLVPYVYMHKMEDTYNNMKIIEYFERCFASFVAMSINRLDHNSKEYKYYKNRFKGV